MIKRNRNELKLNNEILLLKKIFLVISLALMVVYLIRGGLYSLLFDLRESKAVIIYSIIMVILIAILILLNVKDFPENQTEKEMMLSSYITVGVIVLIIVFGLLLIFTLIDFFLPIIVFGIILIVIYFILLNIIKNKYNRK